MTITVGVLFGADSNEHLVSCVSAGNVIAHCDNSRYKVIPIGITLDGKWVSYDHEDLPTTFSAATNVVDNKRYIRVVNRDRASDDPDAVAIDVMIPMLHGKNGEDGTVQGLLEVLKIPYIGAKVLASAVAMDKFFTKRLLEQAGLPIGPYVHKDLRKLCKDGHKSVVGLTDQEWELLGPVVYVKPARGGSSVGVTRVDNRSDLPQAIAIAAEHDDKIMIEKAILGTEIEVAVLQLPDGSTIASTPAEITMPTGEATYDFSSKYQEDIAIISLPAPIATEDILTIQQLALRVFDTIDCQGLARVDFFLTAQGPLVNEINTMPGFTPTSQYPQMMAYDGMSYSQLISTLIDTELALYHRQYSFSS